MNIPVFKPYLDNQEIQAAVEALKMGWLGPGSYVKEFEQQLANLLKINSEQVVAVNTGTSAVHLGLKILGVGHNDEVITPSFNNIADFQAIRALHAEPVFCDIKKDSLTMDVDQIEPLISEKTKAIICLDYGMALCDYDAIMKVAVRYNIPVLYDAAHSFGSSREQKMVGSNSNICTFSFDPVKNITCIDGGAIVFKSIEQAEKTRYMRMLGQKQNLDKLYSNSRSWTYDVDDIGYRYHLANLHAAIGIEQLKKLDIIKEKRQKICHFYTNELGHIKNIILPEKIDNDIVPFIYVIRILNGKRAKFREFMKDNGIDTGIHWQPGHMFSYFSKCRKGDLSVTEKIGQEIVTLPLFPELTEEERIKIVSKVKEFFLANDGV